MVGPPLGLSCRNKGGRDRRGREGVSEGGRLVRDGASTSNG